MQNSRLPTPLSASPFAPLLLAVFTAATLFLAGCSEAPPPEAQAQPKPAEAQETVSRAEFDWFLEGRTPAGRTELRDLGDGKIESSSFIHWNNREWTIESQLQLDENGLPVTQRITGISPFQAPIDEAFERGDGEASWRTVGETGRMGTDRPAFYLPAEPGAFESLAALVRVAQGSLNGEVALLPSGTARVEKVRDLEVETGSGSETISLFAIAGIGFTPSYLWMNEQLELIGIDNSGWLGMVPKGWDASVLRQMSRVQLEESARRIQSLAGQLQYPQDQPVIFENVDVADVVSGELLPARYVRVQEGLIESISEVPIVDARALRIDGSGKTLMPGLWDMHGHFALDDGLMNIAGGITSVRDIGSVHDQIMETTAKFDAGEVIGPRTYRAGFMDRAGPYASGWAAETLEDALEQVDFYAEHGYMQIKLYSSIEPEWVAPIAERTAAHGMRLSGHIPAFMSAEQAIRAGFDEIQHINMVFLNFLVGDQGDTRQQIRFTTYGDEAAGLDLDSDAVEAFIQLLKDEEIVVDATAAIFETMLTHTPGNPDPTFAAVIDHLPPAVRRPLYNPEMVLGDSWPESNIRQSQMLKKLHDAGVQLVPGSDQMAPFTVHRELEVYVEAGIPAAEVLRIGTIDSARVTGVDAVTGSIEVGKHSDLVLVEGNPLEDISAVRRAVLVMKGNTLYRPDELYKAVGVKPFLPSVNVQRQNVAQAGQP